MKARSIISDPPFGMERAYNALRLAGALAKKYQAAQVHSVADGGRGVGRRRRPEDARGVSTTSSPR